MEMEVKHPIKDLIDELIRNLDPNSPQYLEVIKHVNGVKSNYTDALLQELNTIVKSSV